MSVKERVFFTLKGKKRDVFHSLRKGMDSVDFAQKIFELGLKHYKKKTPH